MLQQVTVTTETTTSLKPLLEPDIRAEPKTLAHGLDRTQARLAEFEQRYGLASAEFERRFAARELDESLDFIEWSGELKTLRLLVNQQRALRDARLS